VKAEASKIKDPTSSAPTYCLPTQTFPFPPPPECLAGGCNDCRRCTAIADWHQNFCNDVDDLILRSNIHTHYRSVEDEQAKENKKDWKGLKRGNKTSKPNSKFVRLKRPPATERGGFLPNNGQIRSGL
jgi:hypothetical protein